MPVRRTALEDSAICDAVVVGMSRRAKQCAAAVNVVSHSVAWRIRETVHRTDHSTHGVIQMARAKRKSRARRNSRASQRSRSSRMAMDAISLLKADHREVEGWFAQFEKTRSDDRKLELAGKICAALKMHTTIEEEIFYPAFLEATEETDIHHEAEVEHNGAKKLIA